MRLAAPTKSSTWLASAWPTKAPTTSITCKAKTSWPCATSIRCTWARWPTRFPQAKTYVDFRQMLDQEKNLDGVVVSTPDHTHAVAVMAALERGLDVYCEKPLAHSVYEVRQMRNEAAEQQGRHADGHADSRRRELSPRGRDHQGRPDRPGVAGARVDGQRESARRPRQGGHAAVDGRLRLVDWPGADAAVSPVALPLQLALLVGFRRRHAGRLRLPLHGPAVLGARPAVSDFGGSQGRKDFAGRQRSARQHARRLSLSRAGRSAAGASDLVSRRLEARGGGGVRQGARPCCSKEPARAADCWPTTARASCSCSTAPSPSRRRRRFPTRSAIGPNGPRPARSRGQTTCNFDYSGALAEAVLLGNVSYRAGGKKLDWDAESLKATNCPEADAFIKRTGWTCKSQGSIERGCRREAADAFRLIYLLAWHS